MILLDTNILVYAVGSDHPLRLPCRRLLAAHAGGHVDCATTIAVIQEFAHTRARRYSRPDALQLARFYRRALHIELLVRGDLDLGLTLFERHPALDAFDALLASVALSHGADWLISADRAFGSVPYLPWIDPASPDLDQLLHA